MRILAGLPYRADAKQAFISLGILTLPCQYILQSILHIHSKQQTLLKHSDVHLYNTRHKQNLVLPKTRLNSSRHVSNYYGLKFFNHLPTSIRELEPKDLKIFLKKLLVNSAFYDFEEFLQHKF